MREESNFTAARSEGAEREGYRGETREHGPEDNPILLSLLLWVAEGFGTGRVPVAPGTFGSLLGVVWFLALLATGQLWLYCAYTLVGIAVSVQICGLAEKSSGDQTQALSSWMRSWPFLSAF